MATRGVVGLKMTGLNKRGCLAHRGYVRGSAIADIISLGRRPVTKAAGNTGDHLDPANADDFVRLAPMISRRREIIAFRGQAVNQSWPSAMSAIANHNPNGV
jgi:hypothetical protein